LGKQIVSNSVVSFELFCKLFPLDPTRETLEAFQIFDEDGSGTVEISELMLVLVSLVNVSVKDKCQFIFDLFDEDRNGQLSQDAVEVVLSANHMQPRSAMTKKAKLILRSVGKGSDGITVDELIVCAEKFPNILFPKLELC